MLQLGVNIDHVATVRQARYRGEQPATAGLSPEDAGEPDPVRAAHEAELGGADGITVHLREDRRHITDRDVRLLQRLVKVKLNLEMAATEEMVGIACELRPHTAMLVPEGREEVTTEGGLDVAGQAARMSEVVARLRDAGLIVSAFIDAEPRQVDACHAAGFDVCEVHTGPWAQAFARCGGDPRRSELVSELGRVARTRANASGTRGCGSTRGTRSTTTTSGRSRRCPASKNSTSVTPS
jgi:pyridoxine 5-phosphate synthase